MRDDTTGWHIKVEYFAFFLHRVIFFVNNDVIKMFQINHTSRNSNSVLLLNLPFDDLQRKNLG